MTYRQICQRLQDAGIEAPEWDAALLIEHFCHIPADRVPLSPNEDLACTALAQAVDRRAQRYPLQYLVGEWQFYRQTYEVSPDCLIPRSDTEILVEEAIRRLPQDAHFADLCTGSGCIAVSVLAERPDTTAEALDKYPKTLELATRNAEKNRVRERFQPILADVLQPDCLGTQPRFHAILSNPPYISADALKTLAPEPCAEPRVALDGGVDGLLFYRAILNQLMHLLLPGGFLLLEIGFDQAESVTAIAKAAGFAACRVLKDYGGNDRVLLCEQYVPS